MKEELLYEKIKELLDFVEEEAGKTIENHTYECRIWSKGYRNAMVTVKNYIWNIFNSSN